MTLALPSDRRSPRQMSYWLWMLVVAMASAIGVFAAANTMLPPDKAVTADQLGQDFLAFYTAGRMVDSGDAARLYDLDAVATLQSDIAAESRLKLVSDVAPWWNPPFAAWLFAPFGLVSYPTALVAWTMFNLACVAIAGWLLTRLILEVSERRRDWLLVPALLAIAPPTIQFLGHGQNTGVSLLLLTLCVLAWRADRPLLAGVAWAFLCYKPQLAALVGVAMFATMGWRFLVGAMLGLIPLLVLTLEATPGAITSFVLAMPANLTEFERTHPPLWHRHVTIESFLRAWFGASGNVNGWIMAGSWLAIAGVLFIVGRAWWQLRKRSLNDDLRELSLDRFIALVLFALPLTVNYFVDYDLLVLAIGGVLVGREMLLAPDTTPAARALRVLGPITFVWLAANPVIAGATGFSASVPLLLTITLLQARRCSRVPVLIAAASTSELTTAPVAPQRLAA